MKRLFILALSLICMQVAMAQGWNAQLVSSTDNEIIVELNVDGFITNEVATPNGNAVVITNNKMMLLAQAGEPNVPSVVIPTIVGDKALMNLEVVETQYVDYENIEIAPSKGDFPRSINPEDVPYTYGAMYQQDAFYPAQIARLDEPYIHRDVRGQNMVVTPYSYNPVTKTMRVYNHMVLRMANVGVDNRNIVESRSKSMSLDPEFKNIYESRYINYAASMAKYNAIAENGELLIICHDAFMSAMEPFVTWKKQTGRPTNMVGTSVAGTTAAAIQSYIATYYTSHPNLTDILLVGDVAQIPGTYVSAGSGYYGYSGYGDLPYGQLAGNDSYNEVLVGRFCCENVNQVTNHVNKVLNYERDLDETATWLTVGQGVSTSAGSGGHFNEDDYQHIDNIRNDLLGYGYTNVYRDYQSVSGTTASSASVVSQHINGGVSIINYCNHGSETSWGVFNYSNSHVNALTNDYKLPYIISVACLNGKYDYSSGCFAEAWMRATNNSTGNPTGAIGGMFSYISQPWVPPMYGQDEMMDILVESYSNNIKRTMGGVSVNGNMKVLDQGATQNTNNGTYNCWILFGDPSLTLRTAVPTVMTVNAPATMTSTATSYAVSATNANGATATLTFNGEILGSATITNGSANITFTAPGSTGTATLTVFGYNKKTYITTVTITGGGAPTPVNVSVSATQTVIAQGSSTKLTAQATGGDGTYTYSWTPAESLNNANIQEPTATPTSTTTYTCVVTSAGLSASNTCTVTVVVAPENLTANVQGNNNVQLSWNSANPATNYIVYRNNTAVANNVTATSWTDTNVAPGTYNYQVAAVYNNVTSPKSNAATVTIYAPLAVVASANPATIDLGQTTTLTANVSGGTGNYTYAWTPSETLETPNAMTTAATPTETTIYTVSVSDGMNTMTAMVTVTVNTIVVCPAPENFTGENYYEDGEFGAHFAWDRAEYEFTLDRFELYRSEDGENYEMVKRIVNTPSVTHYECKDKVTKAGLYHYMIIAFYQNECESEPLKISIEVIDYTAVGENWKDGVAVYPNPSSGKVNIKAEAMRQITIVNAIGQVVLMQDVDNDEVVIDMSAFENGMYLVNIITDNGAIVKAFNVLR